VFWIDAETTTKFEQGYQEIAKTVRVKGRNEKGADILNLVYEWLRDKSNGNWVMILDNADDKDVFTSCPSSHRQASSGKHIGDFLPQSSNGSILVTSRSRDAAFQVTCNYKYIFTVEPMTESEAMELLQSQLEGKHPEPEMKLLAEALGFVPLAISQAAANISRRSLPISNYLEELRKGNESSASLLDESSPQLRRDSGRTNSIVATWKVTFEYVRRTTPSAARLLSLMCFFDRQNIPEALLEGQYGEEVNIKWQQYRKTWWKRKLGVKRKKAGLLPVKILPCDFETDWLTLRDFSLIKMDQNRGNFSMHPMVQFTTLKWLVLHRERDVWSQHFTSLMNDKFPTPGYSVSRECDRLIAHAFAAIPYRPADTATRSLQTWAELTLKVADYYKDFRTAIDFAQKLYRIVAEAFDIVFGEIAPASLALHSKRGTVLMFLDRNVEAEKLHRRTLHLQSHALGPTHPDTLTTMDHVGETLAAQGRDSEAEELLVGALNTRLRIFGPRHEITQNALYARGMYLRQRSRYGEAHDVWRRAHEARAQRDANVYDLTWAVQLTSLGIWPQMSGNAKEAERYFREALSERAKGPIDADYAMCLAQIARTLVAQGDLEGAEPLFRRACEWYDKQASSKSDQDKFYISMELAMVLSKSDDCLDEAEQHTRQCLNALLEHDEAKPDDVCAARRILGNVLEKRRRCEGALDQYRQAYDGAKRFLGEQHGDTQEYRRLYDELLEKSSSAPSATVPGETAETLRDGHASSLDGLVHGAWQSEHQDDDTTAGAEKDNTARQHKGTKTC
jgi:tetratricopeptide (TPR) repeat protein